MGFVSLIAVVTLVAIALAQMAAVVLSARHCRAVPLFWILAGLATVLGPLVLTGPLLSKEAGAAGSWFAYLFMAAFNRFNMVCFAGAALSAVVALLPWGSIRILSAAGWGFASAFAVHVVRQFP